MNSVALAVFMFGPETWIIAVVAIAVLFGGGKKIPELMRGVGQGVRELKKGMNEDVEDEEKKDEKKKDEAKKD